MKSTFESLFITNTDENKTINGIQANKVIRLITNNYLRMKDLLKISFIFLLLHIVVLSFAQRKEDVVYLSNGSVIRGVILKDSTGNSVRIMNHAGDIWAFAMSEIDSVTREKPFEYKAMIFNKRGFEINLSTEFLIRSNENAIGKAVIPGIEMLIGYRHNRYLTLGIETGMQFYQWMEIPFSASVHGRITGRSFSPFILAKAGFTLPAEKREDDWEYKYKSLGGFHSAMGLGIEKIINENAALLFTFSYYYQELNYHLTPLNTWSRERDRKETYSRFRLAVGYVFK